MSGFKVLFTPQSLDDIQNSYKWGVVKWGKPAAEKWLRELHRCVYQRLTSFPKSCPPAPESVELDHEVRRLIFLRYRILFEIDAASVVVLHVTGPYDAVSDEAIGE